VNANPRDTVAQVALINNDARARCSSTYAGGHPRNAAGAIVHSHTLDVDRDGRPENGVNWTDAQADIAVGAPCPSRYRGGLSCDLRAGHEGVHGEVMGRDDEGRVEDAVTWTDAEADAPQASLCLSTAHGLGCERAIGHVGKHGHVLSLDRDSCVDDAVTWTNAEADVPASLGTALDQLHAANLSAIEGALARTRGAMIEHFPDRCGAGCVARGSVTDTVDGREHDACLIAAAF
jgi:hypothetical protein